MYWVTIEQKLSEKKFMKEGQFFHSITDILACLEQIKNSDNVRIINVEIHYIEK